MASNTDRLDLYKVNPATDGNDTFNIDTMLNKNWDKIDENVAMVNEDGRVINKDGTLAGEVSQKDFDGHVENVSNPHAVTKVQVGLGSIENYGIASQEEAERGVSNEKYMTPQRTKQAIEALTPEGISEQDVDAKIATHATSKEVHGLNANNVVIGKDATVDSYYNTNVAIGSQSNANGASSTAVGSQANTDNVSTALGYNTNAVNQSVAVGNGATAKNSSVAMGESAQATGTSATALGRNAQARFNYSTAVGQGAQAANINSTALGSGAQATNGSATALGQDASAGSSATAVGRNAQATGTSATALGSSTQATASSAIALGRNAQATETSATALGSGAQALNRQQGILGGTSTSTSNDWIVPGKFTVEGTKNFEMPHPHPDKKETHRLRHSAVESPTAGDNLYRYIVEATEDGQEVELDLPDYFEYLNKDVDVWVNGVDHFGNAYGKVEGNTLKVTCELAGEYKVLVIGTRNDDHQSVQDWDIKGVEREVGESWTGETYVFEVDEILEIEEIKEEDVA